MVLGSEFDDTELRREYGEVKNFELGMSLVTDDEKPGEFDRKLNSFPDIEVDFPEVVIDCCEALGSWASDIPACLLLGGYGLKALILDITC